tara:strand:- start:4831 stop:5346 length:516 start_codon:yes stop_codon:yes gene_type:complete
MPTVVVNHIPDVIWSIICKMVLGSERGPPNECCKGGRGAPSISRVAGLRLLNRSFASALLPSLYNSTFCFICQRLAQFYTTNVNNEEAHVDTGDTHTDTYLSINSSMNQHGINIISFSQQRSLNNIISIYASIVKKCPQASKAAIDALLGVEKNEKLMWPQIKSAITVRRS